MNTQETFAANMRKYRKAAQLTQEELAEKANLHRTYIGGIEQMRINVSIKNIAKIAGALDIDPALLFLKNAESGSQTHSTSETAAQPRPLEKGDYALLSWNNSEAEFHLLDSKKESLTIRILTSLIRQGYTGNDLVDEYYRAQDEIIKFLERDEFSK